MSSSNDAVWHFHQIQPGENITEPTQGQFFNQDVIAISGSPVRGIVREGIQNALDAKSESQVTVHIALMRGKYACDPSMAAHIFTTELWNHIKANENGLPQSLIPDENSPCDYLVFEDFGTTGLIGDVRQYVRTDEKGSDFFNFFRAAGSTDKHGKKLGKWGIGKHTFWMASRINTVFGLSVREEDNGKPILMGKTILKSHAVTGSQKADHQDGYFGWRDSDDSESPNLVLPLSEESPLEKFREVFSLKRKNELGLSLIVPWVREEIREVKKEQLISDVAQDYFYPILAGDLIVSTKIDSEEEVTLNAQNIGDNVPDIKVKKLIRLAQRMRNISANRRHEVHPSSLSKPIPVGHDSPVC